MVSQLCNRSQVLLVQAVKAIAIARQYLAEEEDGACDLIAQPTFEGDSAKVTIALKIANFIDLETESSVLSVNPNSDPYKIAGAIAHRIRENERVSVTCVPGVDSVFHAVEAIAVSQTYLEEEGIDVKFCPCFTKVEGRDGQESSALHFGILARRPRGRGGRS